MIGRSSVPGPATASRDFRIDALKGFAIICVVTFHALGQYYIHVPGSPTTYQLWAVWLRSFLFSFMLPLFAFLSGYVLGRPGGFRPKTYFTKRTIGLLVPYITWEFFYVRWMYPQMFAHPIKIAEYYVRVFSNPYYEGRMWYLYVLWIALMVLGVARLWGDRTWVILLSVPIVYAIAMHGHFDHLTWMYEYVVFGLLYRRYEHLIKDRLSAVGIACAIAYWPLWLFSNPSTFPAPRLAWTAPTAPLGVLAQQALVFVPLTGICAVVAIMAASHLMPARVEQALVVPGQMSLGIYVTHFTFVEMWYPVAWWFLPINVAIALTLSILATIVLGMWRITALLFLGEPWVRKPRDVGDVQTETL